MNTQVINEWRDATKAQINEPMPKPLPVIEVNPNILRSITKIYRATNAGTMVTTPMDRNTYFMGSHMSCTSITAGINAVTLAITPKGEAAVIINDVYLENSVAITATQGVSNIVLHNGILLERGSVITLAVAGTTSSRTCSIFLSFDDFSNA